MFRSIKAYVAAHLSDDKCAVAVSGGGDSVALLKLLVESGVNPLVLHYNHGIRAESVDEQKFVEGLAKSLNCDIVSKLWENPDLEGNTQQAARNARYSFFDEELKSRSIKHLFIAHTEDDLMETCFLRLSKGSGLAGLPGLKPQNKRNNYTLHRPLLNNTREELREYLKSQNQVWCDDPTNEDTHYWRPRYRKAKSTFEGLGLTPTSLNGFFKSAERINDYFEHELNKFMDICVEEGVLEVCVDLQPLSDLHVEMRWRLYNKITQKLFSISALRSKTKEQLDILIKSGGKISVASGFAEARADKLRFFIKS